MGIARSYGIVKATIKPHLYKRSDGLWVVTKISSVFRFRTALASDHTDRLDGAAIDWAREQNKLIEKRNGRCRLPY